MYFFAVSISFVIGSSNISILVIILSKLPSIWTSAASTNVLNGAKTNNYPVSAAAVILAPNFETWLIYEDISTFIPIFIYEAELGD